MIRVPVEFQRVVVFLARSAKGSLRAGLLIFVVSARVFLLRVAGRWPIAATRGDSGLAHPARVAGVALADFLVVALWRCHRYAIAERTNFHPV